MCGIVGAVAERDVVPILLEGLRRLEYRGYDSAGIAVPDAAGALDRRRAVGKVQRLADALAQDPLSGHVGIAHTRWATHGGVSERNAHPHFSDPHIGVVHNGIIENHDELRAWLSDRGYAFTSETDTEVVAHLVHERIRQGDDLLQAVQSAVARLHGAYAIVVIARDEPERFVTARMGCPLAIGEGIGENFVSSDVQALLPVTRRFRFLEDGDVAEVRRHCVRVFDGSGAPVERPLHESQLSSDAADRGAYRHFMLKEIFEQPRAVAETLAERMANGHVLEAAFGVGAGEALAGIRNVHVVACGTSYHAGLVARHFIERLARIPATVEIASEYRYRQPVVPPDSLLVTISQSGETADTLAALRLAKTLGYRATLSVCNVPESSLVRESALTLMTRAGPEIGVASTKAFTTQIAGLLLLAVALARHNGATAAQESEWVRQFISLPALLEEALSLNERIAEWAEHFADKRHALFLGRGVHHAVAMEGALKLKEISYIHAEAYAAGELKHGPLALVDAEMPVVAVAPNNALLEKLKSNLQEVRARGGVLYVFADPQAGLVSGDGVQVLTLPGGSAPLIDPAIYTVPLQLLAYHVAVLKGTDVDQPRNLAKSVTVE